MVSSPRYASLFVTVLSATTAAAQDPGRELGPSTVRPVVRAVRLDTPENIVLDGRLDEPAWRRAIPATDFIQQVPNNGALATERTEVRFVFSRNALYMGVVCFDSEPDKLLGNTMKRDEDPRADDRFMWVFDTFLNGQNGYLFEMNPSGLLGDALMSATGQPIREWDGIWDARVLQSEVGWTLEIEIPFRTLNFDPSGRAWGVNFQRTIRRKAEETLWTGYQLNQGLKVQYTGLLEGISDVAQGHGLDIRPYGIATGFAAPGRGAPRTRGDADGGVDLDYSLTPALRANLTVNTDFAQTEVDQRQINLTQYSLFFPEKRTFFLEGNSFFDFASFAPGSFPTVVPFFTRRIGLNDNGEPQPINFGAKLIGQVGRQDVGILQMQTARDGSTSGDDFTVVRLRRRMLTQSYVGMLYTRRDTRESNRDTRHTIGVDYRFGTTSFRGSQNLETSGYLLRTTDPLNRGRNAAFGSTLTYPNDRYFADFAFREVQENYDAAVGYAFRNGYRRYAPTFRFQPRPRGGRVRQFQFGIAREDLQFTVNDHFLLRKWDFTPLQVIFQSEDSVQIRYLRYYEWLDRDFVFTPTVALRPETDYKYSRYRLQFDTANRRKIALSTIFESGTFYSGTRDQLVLDVGIRPRAGVVVYLFAEWNKIELPQGRFTTRLYRIALDTQFNQWVWVSNNIQYDNSSQVLGWQSRFRWIITPGNDLYFVYNHNWLKDPILDRFSTLDRRASTKILYTYRL